MLIGAFDFETSNWVNPLNCAIVYETEENQKREDREILYIRRDKPDEVSEIALLAMFKLSAQHGIKFWYAHNMGNFDGLFIFAAATRLGIKSRALMAGASSIVEWQFSRNGQSIVLRDSFRLVPSSLDSAAKDFELPSRKFLKKSDYSVDPSQWPEEKLKEGAITDSHLVIELVRIIENFVTGWGGELRSTFSSCALSVMQADCGRLPDLRNPFGYKANDYARKSYYGARIEVFRHMPQETLSEYDVNSSYPASMCGLLPWEPQKMLFGMQALLEFQHGAEGIFDCTVEQDMHFPILPYKLPCNDCKKEFNENCEHVRTGSIFFPNGKWRAKYPANELRYAVEQGVSIQIHSGLVYSARDPFSEFVKRLYEMKSTTTGAKRNFCKLTLNGGYGKLGQKPEQCELMSFEDHESLMQFEDKARGKFTRIGSTVGSVAKFRWPAHTNYAMASYITAGSRILLHKYISAAKGVAYCDTDSIHCSLDSMPSEHVTAALGKLKAELPVCKGTYYAPKIYRIVDDKGGKHYASKGFSIKCDACRYELSSPCTCDENFFKVASGAQLETSRIVKAKTQMKSHPDSVIRTTGLKQWHGVSQKRKAIPSADGATIPWSISELLSGEFKGHNSPAYGKAWAEAEHEERPDTP